MNNNELPQNGEERYAEDGDGNEKVGEREGVLNSKQCHRNYFT